MTEEKKYQVVMPKLGMIMEKAVLVEWFSQDGSMIKKGEPLFSLESEKSTIEIEAPASGKLQILVPAGDEVPVMTPVANILGAKAGSAAAGETPQAAARKDSIRDDTRSAASRGGFAGTGIAASPRARTLARERSLSLEGLQGTGVRGMITAGDLPDAPAAVKATPLARRMAREHGIAIESLTGSGPGGRIDRADILKAARQRPAAPTHTAALTGLRGIIAERLTASWQERPQVTLVTELDVSALVQARKAFNQEHGEKVSYNALLVSACAQALAEHPGINVRLDSDGLRQLPDINIGVAVDTENGLMVPVLRNAGEHNLLHTEQALQGLISRTLSGSALPDELSGGTFTITNLGAFGIDAFTPILNPPEAAILGVGRIMPRPVVVDGQLAVRETLTLSLVFDHRLIDGAPAARFLQRVSQLLNQPVLMTGFQKQK